MHLDILTLNSHTTKSLEKQKSVKCSVIQHYVYIPHKNSVMKYSILNISSIIHTLLQRNFHL